jgi:hypothetical protein
MSSRKNHSLWDNANTEANNMNSRKTTFDAKGGYLMDGGDQFSMNLIRVEDSKSDGDNLQRD